MPERYSARKVETEATRITGALRRLGEGIKAYGIEKSKSATKNVEHNIDSIIRVHLDDLEAIDQFINSGRKISEYDSNTDLADGIEALLLEKSRINKNNKRTVSELLQDIEKVKEEPEKTPKTEAAATLTVILKPAELRPAELSRLLPKVDEFRQIFSQKQPESTRKYIRMHFNEIEKIQKFSNEFRETAGEMAQEFFRDYVFDMDIKKNKTGMIGSLLARDAARGDKEALGRLTRAKELAEFMKSLKESGSFDFEVGETDKGEQLMGFKDYDKQINTAISKIESYGKRAEKKKAAAV